MADREAPFSHWSGFSLFHNPLSLLIEIQLLIDLCMVFLHRDCATSSARSALRAGVSVTLGHSCFQHRGQCRAHSTPRSVSYVALLSQGFSLRGALHICASDFAVATPITLDSCSNELYNPGSFPGSVLLPQTFPLRLVLRDLGLDHWTIIHSALHISPLLFSFPGSDEMYPRHLQLASPLG